MSKHDALQNWFDELQPLAADTMPGDDRRAILNLVNQPGFYALARLMFTQKLLNMTQLTHLDVSQPAQARMVSVLQGKIQGIDAVCNVMLSLIPDEVPTAEKKQ